MSMTLEEALAMAVPQIVFTVGPDPVIPEGVSIYSDPV